MRHRNFLFATCLAWKFEFYKYYIAAANQWRVSLAAVETGSVNISAASTGSKT